jgi:5'-nucleotidase
MATPATALDVALTNDDGWQAPGIQSLYAALVGAGHRVTMAAPSANQSGSSAASNMGALRITREREDQFSVSACHDRNCGGLESAKPATSALVAIDIARQRNHGRSPDLLVSGINAGANTGAAALISGTVGAANVALTASLGGGVPAIAISTDEPPTCEGDRDCVRNHYDRVSEFAVHLIGQLVERRQRDRTAALLPTGTGLNVNYPGATPRGVRVAVQGRSVTEHGRAMTFRVGCDQCTELALGQTAPGGILGAADDPGADVENSDARLHGEQYVTIVPIEADFTSRNPRRFRWLERAGLH